MTSTDETVRPAGTISSTVGLRARSVLAGVPRPLVALTVAVAAVGLAWALILPPFQAPDEASHFAYAQSLATRFALPGDAMRSPWSSDQTIADSATRASILNFAVESMRPPWSEQSFEGYLSQASHHPAQSNGGGPNPVAVNPPLFYLFSDLAYWASSSESLFGRLYAMRAWGVVLLLATVIGAWLLAGEALGRRRLVQLVCAAVCGLMPMETFMSTSVSPDALMIPLWTFALWLGSRLIRRGWHEASAVALCGVTAAAILTKATSYALLPATLFALVVAWRQVSAPRRRALLKSAGASLVCLAAPVVAWVAIANAHGRPPINTVHGPIGTRPTSAFTLGGFISYLWEFYLPRLPFMSRIEPQHRAAYFIWLKQGWAAFGWLDVWLPRWAYQLFAALTALVAVTSAGILTVTRSMRRLPLLGFFALAPAALLFGLHLTDYRAIIVGQGALLQGRYLLPVIGLFGLAVALIVRHIPVRWRASTAGVVLAALLILQVLSLATIVKAYYT